MKIVAIKQKTRANILLSSVLWKMKKKIKLTNKKKIHDRLLIK